MKRAGLVSLLLALALFSSLAFATNVSGPYSTNQNWTAGGNPYIVTGSVTINSGVTLNVGPGVLVKFDSNTSLTINGKITAQGNSGSPIVFTSNQTTPAPGNWGNITFGSGSDPTSIISDATISYGVDCVRVTGPSPTLDYVTISNCSDDGIVVTGSNANPTFSNGTITNNGGEGIEISSNGGINLTNSAINNNTSYAITTVANTRINGLTGVTMSGNVAGNVIRHTGGTISTNETWGAATWLITADTGLDSTRTLTIAAGAVIKSNSNVDITIYGTLIADGTAAPITFTSSATNPAPGGWGYLAFSSSSSSSSVLKYVTISYGSGGRATAIQITNASPTFEHVTVSNSQAIGMNVFGTSNPTVSDSTFSNNATNAIRIETGARMTLNTSTLSNNGDYPIQVTYNTALDGLSAVTLAGNGGGAKNAINHIGGAITDNETWASALPWHIAGTLFVNSGASLTLAAGAVLKFANAKKLSISGKLSAEGTQASPILLTCDAASPGPACWQGIEFTQNSDPTSRIAYATISFAGDAFLGANVYVTGSSPTLDHDTISGSGGNGVFIAGSGTPLIQNCTFSGNVGNGLQNGSPGTPIDGRFNYWNAATGPSGSGPGSGQAVSTGVKFDPWLISAPSNPHYVTDTTVLNPLCNPVIGVNCMVDFDTILPGNWVIKILNGSGTPVRTVSGTGDTGSFSWDGKDDLGVLLANASYNYQIESTTAASEVATPVRGVATLNTNVSISITDPAISQLFFSPNADTVQDTTTVSSSANFDSVGWTLLVKNSGGTTVRTVTGQGRTFSFTWDGRNDSSVIQPDGIYTMALTGAAGSSNQTKSPTLALDNTPPTTLVVSPAEGETVSNIFQSGSTNVDVFITALDTNFNNWIVDRRLQSTSNWTWLAGASTTGTNIWSTTYESKNLANGSYILRLRCFDRAGNSATDQHTINTGNFSASQSVLEINTTSGQTVSYTSVVPFTIQETLYLKNAQGTIVRTLFDGTRGVGTYNDSWNCTNDSGARLPDGPYHYGASASAGSGGGGGGGSGGSMTWDLTGQSLDQGYEIFSDIAPVPPADPWNNQPLTFTYDFTNAGRVTIKFSPTYPVNGGPNACAPPNFCLKDLVYEDSSPHVVTWAGIDSGGVLRPEFGWVGVNSAHNDFSKNAVVCYGTQTQLTAFHVFPPMFGPLSGTQSLEAEIANPLNHPVDVKIEIQNYSSHSILKTLTVDDVVPGHFATTWDGRADNGMLVSPGPYILTLTATDTVIGSFSTIQALTTIQY